ncbi:hypothetical protein DdX_15463 [Ditylenchus destructor]|uniref:Uncharacterized protein n=1 Tax=Ditylenchus destructor TaxID=166010 RepID=A0AAD4MPE8_9BILA|nr:hypothetical protein DdX_15463 [Ditylenchus destructor]
MVKCSLLALFAVLSLIMNEMEYFGEAGHPNLFQKFLNNNLMAPKCPHGPEVLHHILPGKAHEKPHSCDSKKEDQCGAGLECTNLGWKHGYFCCPKKAETKHAEPDELQKHEPQTTS